MPKLPENLSEKTCLHITYALYLSSLLLGITAFLGVLMNYLRRDAVKGTIYEQHHNTLITTFWISLGALLFCLIWSSIPVIGLSSILGWLGLVVWFLYRVISGWLALNAERASPSPSQ
jgi:uncharacterized membrane protein